MAKLIDHKGHQLWLDEQTGEVREPRFDMPFKEPFENDRIRIIKRTGNFQILVEIYFKNAEHTFRSIRIDKTDVPGKIFIDMIFKRHKDAYGITEADMLETGFKEYKANFREGRWMEE